MNYVQSALVLEEKVFVLEPSHFNHWEEVQRLTNQLIVKSLVGKGVVGEVKGSIKSMNQEGNLELWYVNKKDQVHVRNYSPKFILNQFKVKNLSELDRLRIEKALEDLFFGLYNLVKNEVLFHNMWEGKIVKPIMQEGLVEVEFTHLKTKKVELRKTTISNFAMLIKKQLQEKENDVLSYLDKEELKILESNYHLCSNVLKLKGEKLQDKMNQMAIRCNLNKDLVEPFLKTKQETASFK